MENKTRELVLPDLFLVTCYLLPLTLNTFTYSAYSVYIILEGMGSPTPPSWLMDCMIDDTMLGKFKYENCGNCGLVSWWIWRYGAARTEEEDNWYSSSLIVHIVHIVHIRLLEYQLYSSSVLLLLLRHNHQPLPPAPPPTPPRPQFSCFWQSPTVLSISQDGGVGDPIPSSQTLRIPVVRSTPCSVLRPLKFAGSATGARMVALGQKSHAVRCRGPEGPIHLVVHIKGVPGNFSHWKNRSFTLSINSFKY
jgi:hypothetical protein